MAIDPSHAFNALMQRFTESQGNPQPSAQQCRGFEFESEGHVFRCFAHPTQSDQMMLECDIVMLDESQQRNLAVLRLLNQINDSLWVSSNWFLLVDNDGQALIARQQSIESSSPADLNNEICAAIDKAAALKQVIEASVMIESSSVSGSDPTPPHARFA